MRRNMPAIATYTYSPSSHIRLVGRDITSMVMVRAFQLSSEMVCAKTRIDTPTLIILNILRKVCSLTFILERASAFLYTQSSTFAITNITMDTEIKVMTIKLTKSLPVSAM